VEKISRKYGDKGGPSVGGNLKQWKRTARKTKGGRDSVISEHSWGLKERSMS
jgi:hypothetical protein